MPPILAGVVAAAMREPVVELPYGSASTPASSSSESRAPSHHARPPATQHLSFPSAQPQAAPGSALRYCHPRRERRPVRMHRLYYLCSSSSSSTQMRDKRPPLCCVSSLLVAACNLPLLLLLLHRQARAAASKLRLPAPSFSLSLLRPMRGSSCARCCVPVCPPRRAETFWRRESEREGMRWDGIGKEHQARRHGTLPCPARTDVCPVLFFFGDLDGGRWTGGRRVVGGRSGQRREREHGAELGWRRSGRGRCG